MTCAPPKNPLLRDALYALRDALGRDVCYAHRGRYHFRLTEEWSISAESAGRFRVDACYLSTPRATLLALAGDRERLERVALELSEKVIALV